MAGQKILADNRKARHDYFLEESFEAGVQLTGTEVKSLRLGRAQIKDSFVRIENGEAIVYNMHISAYEQGNRFNHDPLRPRKLLLHKKELDRLYGKTREKGYTIVPVKIYLKGGWIKIEISLAKGKKSFDKRETIAKRDADRKIAQALRERNK